MDSFSHRKRKFFFAWCVELFLESKLSLAYSERGERNGSQLLPSSPVLLPHSNGLILVEDDRMCNTFAMTSSPGGGSSFLGLTSSSSDGAAARGASFSIRSPSLQKKCCFRQSGPPPESWRELGGREYFYHDVMHVCRSRDFFPKFTWFAQIPW